METNNKIYELLDNYESKKKSNKKILIISLISVAATIIATILILILSSFIKYSRINNELQGIWIYSDGTISVGYSFGDDNKFAALAMVGDYIDKDGYIDTYKIGNGKIYIGDQNEVFSYTYENGDLRLYGIESGVEFQKAK